jgi:Ca2+-binding EF-hand superfamily protein
MSVFTKRLFEALDKLNEMGQLLLVVNNLNQISEEQRKELKNLAIVKDSRMLKALEGFKKDHDEQSLRKNWKSLIQIGESPPKNFEDKQRLEISESVQSSKKAIQQVPGVFKIVEKVLKEKYSLLSLREVIGLQKKSPQEMVSQIKSVYKTTDNLNFQDFSKLILQLETSKDNWDNLNKVETSKKIFDLFDENKNGLLTKKEVLNNIILLCGGTPEEKINAVFLMYDTEGDGLITYNNVLEHQICSFKILFLLKSSAKKLNLTPENLAAATTDSIFQEINSSEKLISEPEYLAWYKQEKVSSKDLEQKESRVRSRLKKQTELIEELKSITKKLSSKENLSNIQWLKSQTGLGKVPVHDALRVFKQKNSSGYFSRQQFCNTISELSKKYNPDFYVNSKFYNAVYQLFTKIDRDGNGVVDSNELFCGVSIVCSGNLGDKAKAACDSFDESGDGLIQFNELLKFFSVVLGVICGDFSHYLIDIDLISKESALSLFNTFKIPLEDAITSEHLRKWILTTRLNIYQ